MIPEIGLGTWEYRGGAEPLRRGIELGACFVDTAESYGTKVFSDWLERHAKGVSNPHWPTATTRRSLAAIAREEATSGDPIAAAAEARLRNVRRLIAIA